MLDKFREWLSDNLRYILLGLIILVILIVLFFAGKAISGMLGDNKDKKPKSEAGQENVSDNTVSGADADSQGEDTDALQKNAFPEINDIVNTFYTAWGNKDIESMKSVTDNFDATDEAKVQNSTYIENYSNINVYTKKGLTENSYVVYVSYELKFQDIDTPAPGLTQLYVEKNEEGKFFIHTGDDDPAITEHVNKVTQEADVQALITETQTQYQAAQESDEKLRQFEEELGKAENTATQAADGATLTAKQECNIREGASTDAKKIGEVPQGGQVKKLGNADDGWINVEYNGLSGYIRGDLLQ